VRLFSLILLLAIGGSSGAHGEPFTRAEIAKVDEIVARALAGTDVPSVSVAVVREGHVAFAKAYGRRSLSPDEAATSDARYGIGSITKQFTATAVLMMADQGKLSLDDKVARYLPGMAGADQITLRQALSHTAGYNSYFMLDFMPAEGERPIEPRRIAERWGKAPLDFPPGSRWDYSNTGYTLAGLIVEQMAGRPLSAVLHDTVFQPLQMSTAAEVDLRPLGKGDAIGYTRYALGAPRAAPLVGKGWEFAAGGLAMSAPDLARWDIGVINQRLLSPTSVSAQQTAVKLNDGGSSGYGLGFYIDEAHGHRRIRHDGVTSGFAAENRIYPDDRAAIVVLVNADFAQLQVANQIEEMLLNVSSPKEIGAPQPPSRSPTPPIDANALAVAKQLTAQLRTGDLDRKPLTPDVDAYFSNDVVADYGRTLSKLGEPSNFVQLKHDRIGGLNASLYEVTWPNQTLIAVLRQDPDGKVASFVMFAP
jgi:D-alanyl-D-alanine carboxypeptidase